MERKGCKRFATTTEAEIEEKRLKLNAERTIKQNKAAAAILKDYLFQKKMETGKNIKTLVKFTWKWVIYYTADALKSLFRRQHRTRTLKKTLHRRQKHYHPLKC